MICLECDDCWERCLEEKRKTEENEIDDVFEECEYCECPKCNMRI